MGRLSAAPLIALLALLSACSGQATSARTGPSDAGSPAPLVGGPAQLVEPPAPADASLAREVDAILASARHPWLRWPDLADVATDLRALYAPEADRLFWFAGEQAYPALAEAKDALRRAAERGLDPSDFDPERIASEAEVRGAQAGAAEARAHLDVALSASVLRMIDAVHRGRIHPRTLDWGYDAKPRAFDRAVVLREARDGHGVSALLDGLEPSFPHYVRTRGMLARYRALAAAGAPEPVPALPKGRTKVEPGQPWAGVGPLEKRLRVLGDLVDATTPAVAPDGTPLYAGAAVEALKRFQARHLLDADGVVGRATIEALNVPLARRVRQLELALERGRWLPRLGDRPTVFVNVPLFRLWASDPVREQEPLRMKVVVGKGMNHRTPIFVEQMEYVVFRPYWNPPYGIAAKEIVPRARREPGYLERERIEIVARGDESAPALPATAENLDAVVKGRLYLRQKPGPKNSLGLAKFIFPNHENVYMHGTPAPQLFARSRRDFSHGCIRLEDPAALAEWVLRDQPGWTRARIDAAMQAERPTRVNLKEPLRVVLFYDTVHVNSEGVVHFVGDIYGHDRALDQALAQGYPYPEPGS